MKLVGVEIEDEKSIVGFLNIERSMMTLTRIFYSDRVKLKLIRVNLRVMGESRHSKYRHTLRMISRFLLKMAA